MAGVTIPYFHVDAFADRPFTGNPAAVCLLDGPREPDWMRRVAAEIGLSEAAFLVPGADGFDLRWFTPLAEVDLCGHATLASAHVLWQTGRLEGGEAARFHTRSGLLTATLAAGWITLDFPALPVEPGPVPDSAVAALGVEPIWTGTCGPRWIVEVADESVVRDVRPDFLQLRSIRGRALAVTAQAAAGRDYDFLTRYFAPWVGVDEDPVTGSIHCALGPLWGARLGKTALSAFQASPRGGALRIDLAGDRVRLGGRAVTVVSGTLAA